MGSTSLVGQHAPKTKNKKAERERREGLASGRRGHTAPTLRIASEAARLGWCGPHFVVGLRGPVQWDPIKHNSKRFVLVGLATLS